MSWHLLFLRSSGIFLATCALSAPGQVAGQAVSIDAGSEWNSPQALDLVERGREARGRLATDGDLDTYRALVEGSIYFYLDPEVGERALIRVDQVAVEVQWRAPDQVRQRLVGERSETRLPVQDFRYYIDRITLVHYGFDDEIRIGQGRDVRGVPHPLAGIPEGLPLPYDFRVIDSISLTLPGREGPLRLQTLEVRPRNPSLPGVIGTLTLEAETAHIVRMAITFTPSSYVDPRTDQISAQLDYGLWDGRYWLPNLQQIEVRREIPEIDIGVGTVIRSVLRTGNYELNAPLSESFAVLPPITSVSPQVRASYPFTQGLYEGLTRDGLAEVRVETDLAVLREEAIRRIRETAPSGLSPLRFHIPRLSSVLRYSRAEGGFVGVGGSFVPGPQVRIRGQMGAAIGAREVQGAGEVGINLAPGWRGEIEGHYGTLGDLGLAPGIDGLLSSLSALTRGEDYLDPFRSSGVGGRVRFPVGDRSMAWVGLGFERMENVELAIASAPLNRDRSFRPIRQIAEGNFGRLGAGLQGAVSLPGNGRGWSEVTGEFLTGSAGDGGSLSLGLDLRWGPLSGERDVQAVFRGFWWGGDPLPQGERLFGGRGTLPGYPYRSFSANRTVTGSLLGSSDLWGQRVRLRGGLHGGWGAGEGGEAWGTEGTGGLRSSATLGVGIGWDLLRIDLARGFNGGEWQWIFSIDPRWWDRL